MTKAELIDKVAKDAGISKVAAAAALQSFMDNVTKALKKPEGKVTSQGRRLIYVNSKRRTRSARPLFFLHAPGRRRAHQRTIRNPANSPL